MLLKIVLLVLSLTPSVIQAEVLGRISDADAKLAEPQPVVDDRRITYRVICSPEEILPECQQAPISDTTQDSQAETAKTPAEQRTVAEPETDMDTLTTLVNTKSKSAVVKSKKTRAEKVKSAKKTAASKQAKKAAASKKPATHKKANKKR